MNLRRENKVQQTFQPLRLKTLINPRRGYIIFAISFVQYYVCSDSKSVWCSDIFQMDDLNAFRAVGSWMTALSESVASIIAESPFESCIVSRVTETVTCD